MNTIDFTDSIYDAQQGSQNAIHFIYDNTIQYFYKEARIFMRDRSDADDAVRDAYAFIFNHLDSLEDSSKFLVWSNEVCKNTCISKLKQSGAFDERIPAEAANIGDISASSEYDPYINPRASMPPNHVQACLEAILNSLPDNQRTCAVLWGQGYPLRSISRKVGISTAAVNYTLAYALGNISNSVTILGDNGLPLYSMDPIPYFLWLLINYYQDYTPQDTDTLVQSSFSNILRILLPDEASVYSAQYSENLSRENQYDENGKIEYEGSFVNGLKQGKGKEYNDNGKIKYEGDFKNGEHQRKIYDENGNIIYEGDFSNCKYDGIGKEYYANGKIKYEGCYKNGHYEGKGKFYYDNGKIKYEGDFKNDNYEGKGKLYNKNGNIIYEGYFEYDKNIKASVYNEIGTLYYENGNIKYTGQFYKGHYHDSLFPAPEDDKIYYENGNIKYIGDFHYDKLYYENGNIKYIGGFSIDKYHGKGILYKPDGTIEYSGKFKDGKPDDNCILF